MSKVQFSVLSYYPSIVNDENINVGLLFYISDTNGRYFYISENTKRLQSFDDELDVKFMMNYLKGIKEEWEESLFGIGNDMSIESFIYNYGNELRFGTVQSAIVEDATLFIEETKKMNFRFDYDIKDRPTEVSVKRYIKNLLKSNSIGYSTKSVFGGFDENVKYDFVINNYGFKSFIVDDNTNLQTQLMNLKGWAYTAQTNNSSHGFKTVFIVDSDRNDSDYKRARTILESQAMVIGSSDVVSFIQKMKMA